MRIVLNNILLLWALQALPAAWLAYALWSGSSDVIDLIPTAGIVAVRLMIAAMAIGPAAELLGSGTVSRWLLARRRYFGFAAFLYALVHLVLYVIDLGSIADILDEIPEHSIWTGWLALLLMALPGCTSTDAAMRLLRRNWKRVQRMAYPAALITALHWGFLELRWGPALTHFAPLAALNIARLIKRKGT
jgi:sulfoxide reductase heme-binding subunit YedZ